ncbi:hypothetical protein C8R43DRAFT_957551 [Mycena crocata]|nr:hypothetical protein C8R43DRAFT_957551 [Mycena crocata]
MNGYRERKRNSVESPSHGTGPNRTDTSCNQPLSGIIECRFVAILVASRTSYSKEIQTKKTTSTTTECRAGCARWSLARVSSHPRFESSRLRVSEPRSATDFREGDELKLARRLKRLKAIKNCDIHVPTPRKKRCIRDELPREGSASFLRMTTDGRNIRDGRNRCGNDVYRKRLVSVPEDPVRDGGHHTHELRVRRRQLERDQLFSGRATRRRRGERERIDVKSECI